jgi:hypothetical protein
MPVLRSGEKTGKINALAIADTPIPGALALRAGKAESFKKDNTTTITNTETSLIGSRGEDEDHFIFDGDHDYETLNQVISQAINKKIGPAKAEDDGYEETLAEQDAALEALYPLIAELANDYDVVIANDTNYKALVAADSETTSAKTAASNAVTALKAEIAKDEVSGSLAEEYFTAQATTLDGKISNDATELETAYKAVKLGTAEEKTAAENRFSTIKSTAESLTAQVGPNKTAYDALIALSEQVRTDAKAKQENLQKNYKLGTDDAEDIQEQIDKISEYNSGVAADYAKGVLGDTQSKYDYNGIQAAINEIFSGYLADFQQAVKAANETTISEITLEGFVDSSKNALKGWDQIYTALNQQYRNGILLWNRIETEVH